MSRTARQGRSRGEWFESFVPCNPRTRRVLQLNDLYRGFECLPLRHTICNAEKSARLALEFAGNGRNFAILASNRTGESVLLVEAGKLCSPFLWRASERSGFHDSIGRMQCDHKPMIKRKRLDFVGSLENCKRNSFDTARLSSGPRTRGEHLPLSPTHRLRRVLEGRAES
jgi:hypothetical protein